MISTTVHVIETTDQQQLLEKVLLAGHDPRTCAVLDPTWPHAIRAEAREAVEAAASTQRLMLGDLIVFTSGSTRRPRGIIRSVASWQASAQAVTDITRLTAQDAVFLPGPLWSSLFLYGGWHARTIGARTILQGDDPAGATAAHCVPAQLSDLLDGKSDGRLPQLALVIVAGDRLPTNAWARASRLDVRLVEYYGSAELSFVAWRSSPAPMMAFPGAEVRVRERVVWVRSPYLARSYLYPDDEGPWLRDAEGWATVGDLADSCGGGIEVLGRGNAVITTGGHTVIAEEVEDVLSAVPGVYDVGVVGLGHARLGQVVVAVIVGDVDTTMLEATSRTLPAPARPRRWVRAPQLPRTASGKLNREELVLLADMAAT